MRKTFLRCTLCALLRRIVHSYVVYISIIVVSLIAILIQNSNPSVNIRKRLRILEKHARCSLRKKFILCAILPCVGLSRKRQTFSITPILHLLLPFFKSKVEKQCEHLKKKFKKLCAVCCTTLHKKKSRKKKIT